MIKSLSRLTMIAVILTLGMIFCSCNNSSVPDESAIELHYQRVNASNVADANGDFILFGSFPQTIKEESVTVGEDVDGDGYYSGSDGNKYAKIVANPSKLHCMFNSGATITKGATYYFRVEPLKWRILSESDGEALILCENIIANKCFSKISNNYANSEIRVWLNNEFYNKGFNSLEQSLILTTTVDNSEASAGYVTNEFACENTNDKIFLLSYSDMVNTDYGFKSSNTISDNARRKLTSDYSRATGVMLSREGSYYIDSYWWLRSPSDSDFPFARIVYTYGRVIDEWLVADVICGVVPALKIQL